MKQNKTSTGPLHQTVGYPGGKDCFKDGWVNPKRDELMKSAGFFTIKDLKEKR